MEDVTLYRLLYDTYDNKLKNIDLLRRNKIEILDNEKRSVKNPIKPFSNEEDNIIRDGIISDEVKSIFKIKGF